MQFPARKTFARDGPFRRLLGNGCVQALKGADLRQGRDLSPLVWLIALGTIGALRRADLAQRSDVFRPEKAKGRRGRAQA